MAYPPLARPNTQQKSPSTVRTINATTAAATSTTIVASITTTSSSATTRTRTTTATRTTKVAAVALKICDSSSSTSSSSSSSFSKLEVPPQSIMSLTSTEAKTVCTEEVPSSSRSLLQDSIAVAAVDHRTNNSSRKHQKKHRSNSIISNGDSHNYTNASPANEDSAGDADHVASSQQYDNDNNNEHLDDDELIQGNARWCGAGGNGHGNDHGNGNTGSSVRERPSLGKYFQEMEERLYENTVNGPCQGVNMCEVDEHLDFFTTCHQPFSFLGFGGLHPGDARYAADPNAVSYHSQTQSQHQHQQQNQNYIDEDLEPMPLPGAYAVPVGCEYCGVATTKECSSTTCPRPKLFFQKKRPPFAPRDASQWHPRTDFPVSSSGAIPNDIKKQKRQYHSQNSSSSYNNLQTR